MSYKINDLVSYGEEKTGIIEEINGDIYTIRYMLDGSLINGICLKGDVKSTSGSQVTCNALDYNFRSEPIRTKVIRGKEIKYIIFDGKEIYINDSQILEDRKVVRLIGTGSIRSDSNARAAILEVDFTSILETVPKDLVIGMAGGNRRRKSRRKNKKRRSTRRSRR